MMDEWIDGWVMEKRMVGQKDDKKRCIDELTGWCMNGRVERQMNVEG